MKNEMDYPRERESRPHRMPMADKALHRQGRRVLCSSPKIGCFQKPTIQGAIPFDVAGVELGHADGWCSFESIIAKYGLTDNSALARMAKIIHAADVSADLASSPEGAGLKAIAHGFSLLHGPDDYKKMELEFPLYDALYAWCKDKMK